MTKVFELMIRRDAGTITPVRVPTHEIAILQTIFGKESVLRGGVPVSAAELTGVDAAGDVKLPDNEYERLTAKYGLNDEGPLVEQVYGKEATGALATAMEKFDTQFAPAPKAAAKE